MTLSQLFFMILAELQANPAASNRKVILTPKGQEWRTQNLTPDNIDLYYNDELISKEVMVAIYF